MFRVAGGLDVGLRAACRSYDSGWGRGSTYDLASTKGVGFGDVLGRMRSGGIGLERDTCLARWEAQRKRRLDSSDSARWRRESRRKIGARARESS